MVDLYAKTLYYAPVFVPDKHILVSHIVVFQCKKYRSSIYLGAFFLAVSLYGFNQWVLLYSDSVILISLIYTHITFLLYLIGPVLYWYIRSVISDRGNLQKKDLFHLIPNTFFTALKKSRRCFPQCFCRTIAPKHTVNREACIDFAKPIQQTRAFMILFLLQNRYLPLSKILFLQQRVLWFLCFGKFVPYRQR